MKLEKENLFFSIKNLNDQIRIINEEKASELLKLNKENFEITKENESQVLTVKKHFIQNIDSQVNNYEIIYNKNPKQELEKLKERRSKKEFSEEKRKLDLIIVGFIDTMFNSI